MEPLEQLGFVCDFWSARAQHWRRALADGECLVTTEHSGSPRGAVEGVLVFVRGADGRDRDVPGLATRHPSVAGAAAAIHAAFGPASAPTDPLPPAPGPRELSWEEFQAERAAE